MPSIESRLQKLESRAGLGEHVFDVIIRTIVSPSSNGPVECPLRALTSPCGWQIDRNDGESREDFIDRAKTLVPRRPGGIAVLREVL